MGFLDDRVLPYGRANNRYPAPVPGSVLYYPGMPPGGAIIYDKSKPHDIDVGSAASDRDGAYGNLFTYIDLNNPANSTGVIDTVQIWAATNVAGMRVGTFYFVAGTTYTCRHSVAIGNLTAGLQTFTGLNLAVVAGDFLGYYCDSGTIDATLGGVGVISKAGEAIDPGDSASYNAESDTAISLYAIGCTGVVAGNNGTITGATWVRLPTGQWCLYFDGTDDKVDCGTDASLDFTGDGTLVFWIKRNAIVGLTKRVLGKKASLGATVGYAFYFTADEKADLLITTAVTSGEALGSYVTDTTTWHFIACKRASGGWRIQVDGTKTVGETLAGDVTNVTSLQIGSIGGTYGFKGWQSLMRIFPSALSDATLATMRSQERSLYGV